MTVASSVCTHSPLVSTSAGHGAGEASGGGWGVWWDGGWPGPAAGLRLRLLLGLRLLGYLLQGPAAPRAGSPSGL